MYVVRCTYLVGPFPINVYFAMITEIARINARSSKQVSVNRRYDQTSYVREAAELFPILASSLVGKMVRLSYLLDCCSEKINWTKYFKTYASMWFLTTWNTPSTGYAAALDLFRAKLKYHEQILFYFPSSWIDINAHTTNKLSKHYIDVNSIRYTEFVEMLQLVVKFVTSHATVPACVHYMNSWWT